GGRGGTPNRTATFSPSPMFVIPNLFRDPLSHPPGALGRSAASAAGPRNPRGKLGALAVGPVHEEKWVPKRVRDDGEGRVVSFPGDRGSARPLHPQPAAGGPPLHRLRRQGGFQHPNPPCGRKAAMGRGT